MSEQDVKDANLLVVIAVDGYARRHHVTAAEAYERLSAATIPGVIRDHYETLHMLDPFEVVDFVEDVLRRRNGQSLNSYGQMSLMGEYFYKGQDVTICVLIQIENVVRILAERECISFDEMLGRFYKSRTYRNLINPDCTLWAESADYIADDFGRVA